MQPSFVQKSSNASSDVVLLPINPTKKASKLLTLKTPYCSVSFCTAEFEETRKAGRLSGVCVIQKIWRMVELLAASIIFSNKAEVAASQLSSLPPNRRISIACEVGHASTSPSVTSSICSSHSVDESLKRLKDGNVGSRTLPLWMWIF